MKVAFFDVLGEATVVEVYMKNESTSYVTYNGRQFFKAVLPNFEDRTMIKIELDEHSFKFFKDNVTRIKDEVSKTMIWYAFFEMVRENKMTMIEFLQIIKKNIVNEYKDDIVGDILHYAHEALRYWVSKRQKTEFAH